MQELSIVSLTSKHSSETVKKELSGAAFDPLSEVLFASMQRKTGENSSSTLIGVPEKSLQSEVEVDSSLSEEMKSKEYSTQQFKSLASIEKEHWIVESEACPQGEPQYLKPYLLTESQDKGKQIFITDTYHEPDCLRFCPANSTDKILISLSGFTATAKTPSQTARANKSFSEGTHYWEILCPISCSTLQIGVSNKNQKEEVVQQFRTTTPRVIGIELNLESLTLNFWLNGRFIKERVKKVPANQSWYPTVKFKEQDYFVIINPFSQKRGSSIPEEQNPNQLPQLLRQSELQLFNAFISSHLLGILMIQGLNQQYKADSNELDTELRQTLKMTEIFKDTQLLLPEAKDENETIKWALLKFPSQSESLKYYHANKDLKLLFDKQIASLILSIITKQGVFDLTPEVGQQVLTLVNNKIIKQDQVNHFLTQAGLSNSMTIEQLAKKITIFKEEIEKSDFGSHQVPQTHGKSQSETSFYYLENSDKLLLTNDSQLKLITREMGKFSLDQASNFSLQPQLQKDLIRLNTSKQNLKFLIENIDWSQVKNETFDILGQFIEALKSNTNQGQSIVPYNVALAGVRTLLNVAINQYEELEETLNILEDYEVLHKPKPIEQLLQKKAQVFNNKIDLPFQYGKLSIIEANQLLSILLQMEDQLWAMTQSDQVSSQVKDLWGISVSRKHTAYGRLSSLITYPVELNSLEQVDLVQLAELGLINTEDKYGKLHFFQDFKIEVENVFQNSKTSDLLSVLERQFPNNLFFKGLPTWNVPLPHTLNSLPPQVHENSLTDRKLLSHSKIDFLKTLQNQDFIMTACNDGSVNIWSTKLQLQKVGGYNFKQKLYQEGEIDSNNNFLSDILQDKEFKEGESKIYMKSGKQASEGKKKLEKNAQTSEDILYTMFDEAEDVEESEVEIIDLDDNNENISDFLYDYFDQQAVPSKSGKKQEKKLEEEEKKEEVKEVQPTPTEQEEEEKIVEPNQELLEQMTLMGFNVEWSKKALIKTKNESLSTALDAYEEIQKSQPKKEAVQTVKIIQYECTVCTLINPEGKNFCEACGAEAPQSAYVIVKDESIIQKEKEAEELRKKLEEEANLKAIEEERKKQETEEQKRKALEEEKRKKEELKNQSKKFYSQTEVLDYLFCSINNGVESKPFLTAAVLKDNQRKTINLDIIIFSYYQTYLREFIGQPSRPQCQVCDISFINQKECLKHVFSNHRALIEALYPIFIGSQKLNQKWNIKANRQQFLTIKPEQLGMIVLPFEHLDSITQIGYNISSKQDLIILAIGRKQGQQNQTSIIIKASFSEESGDIAFKIIDENSSILKDNGITEKDELLYCQRSNQLVVIQKLSGKVSVFRIDQNEESLKLEKVISTQLGQQGCNVLKIENGILFVKEQEDKIRRIIIDPKIQQEIQIRMERLQNSQTVVKKEQISEEDILKMQIDPINITISDIKRYEKLMNGKPIRAISNCQSILSNQSMKKGQTSFSKHHWNIQEDQTSGPLEMKFVNKTSLISLNIEMTYTCINTEELLKKLQNNSGLQTQQKCQITQKEISQKTGIEQRQENLLNLGLLNISGHSLGPQNQPQSQGEKINDKNFNFLPLIVDHYKGASYNQTYQVSRIVTDNSLIFASNYPKPEFFFKHLHGNRMKIEKFIVRSNVNSKCGAYPVGSGLVFTSDNFEAFEHTTPFHKFTSNDYNEWKQERSKDPTPLKPYEPVAFFEFDSDQQIIVNIDYQRICNYIMLKPTGFRKKPTQFTQNINNVPMEIEFFGVIGQTFNDSTNSANDQDEIDGQDFIQGLITSGYDLDIKILNDDHVLKNIKDVEVHSIYGNKLCLSGNNLLKNSEILQKAKLSGKSTLKITDSHLQLQDISGISLNLSKLNKESNIWQLKGVSIQAIVAEQDDTPNHVSKQPIFNEGRIPTSYMRSCLLSPKFFSVVNKVLADQISNQEVGFSLRITIIQFFNKIMKLDKDFIPLVFEQVELEKFLSLNLFNGECQGTSVIVEFLQKFQKDEKFCFYLYDILLKHIQTLPMNYLAYNGYDAFIGLLKWALPINPEKTLETLFSTMYQDICIDKIQNLQTKELICFRTLHQFPQYYPFDLLSFKTSKLGKTASSDFQGDNQQHNLSNKALLPVNLIRRTRNELLHTFEVELKEKVLVTDIKVHFANLDQVHFKLIVKIFDFNESLIYFNTFDEQIFNQFACLIYQKGGDDINQDDALHINDLDINTDKMKVVIEFGISNSSLPRASVKVKPPNTLIEIFGQTHDIEINPQRIKEMIDNKAKEYWTKGAKLNKVGNSSQMLIVEDDLQTTSIVPQGSIIQGSLTLSKSDKEQSVQMSINEANIQQKTQELILLQQELKGKLNSRDANIKEILEKIQSIQVFLTNENQRTIIDNYVPSLEYYFKLVSDFTKMIRNVVKTQNMNREKVISIIKQISKDSNLSEICFNLFKRFVVFDSGSIKQDILTFIIECLQPLLSNDEKRDFIFRIIDEFLSVPQKGYSQNSVIEALNILGLPEGDLISFLINKMRIQSGAFDLDRQKIQPFVFMSSVLILALNQLKSIDIPEPGQVIHKGISCNGCHSKFIIGWRYKCGHCPGDVNFDEKCVHKHLQEHPHHVMIIVQEPLPYNTNQPHKLTKSKKAKAILPTFEFKEKTDDQVIHEGIACENCGTKPIQGSLFKCANCEDFNICETCYTNNTYNHFSFHVFMKLQQALRQIDKNPTSMLQVLDPRLYPQKSKVTAIESLKSPKKQPKVGIIQQDEEDDFKDLVPLGVQRSLSQPMPAVGKSKSQTHQKQDQKQDLFEKLDHDQQFVILFNACVWISEDQHNLFNKLEKTVLLKLILEILLQLIKLTTVGHIKDVISNNQAFFQVLIAILQLNSKDLIQLFRNLFDHIRQPPSLIRKQKEEASKTDKSQAKSTDKKQQLEQESQSMRQVLEIMIQNIQTFLKWLIDIGIQPDLARKQGIQGQESWKNLLNNYRNQRVWLDHLHFILELFIKISDDLKEAKKVQQGIINGSALKDGALEKIPEEKLESDDDEKDLMPLAVSRSISVPIQTKQLNGSTSQPQSNSLQIIKSLVQLLYINDTAQFSIQSQSPQKSFIQVSKTSSSFFQEQESQTKYLSQVWTFVLKSLTAVSINQLIEAKIFDSLVNAFLISSEEIKQITFPQILNITESIAQQSVHLNDLSKFISNLLFITLENVTNNEHEKVGYSICQGWLDILITSSIARVATYEQNKTVYSQMSTDEISIFLKKSTIYLNKYLNKGSFEGPTGSTQENVMRLNIAADLIYVIRYAENKRQPGTLAIQELFKQVSTNSKLRKDYQDSINNLLCWLFLSSRQSKDDMISSQLGNSSTLNPSTAKVKQITETIEEIFQILGENGDTNEEAVKISLHCLTSIVKKINKTILDLSQSNQIGFELSVKYCERSNEYFTKLLSQWLVSDKVASYFVFDLNGFEFLLDTIGVGSENDPSIRKLSESGFEIIDTTQTEEKKDKQIMTQVSIKSSNDVQFESLDGSDLGTYLEQYLRDSFTGSVQKSSQEISSEEHLSPVIFDKTQQVYVQEFSKNIAMVSTNGQDIVANHLKTDWSVNKRAYKHRILIKHLTGSLRNEYWLMFQFPSPVELREIQIGFNNFWGTDTEIYAEPLSVLVEAGMEENNLNLVCNLQIVKDDGFGSVSATVFGQNLQTFQVYSCDMTAQTIEDIISQKLQSLQNFKVQYIKFCLRRNIITCLENSPLATKFQKQIAFGINYISLLGFELNKIGEYQSYIKQEQKKTALEVLSLICSGDFQNILQVIANQPQTIEKMKKSFNLLASLVSIKANLIEPTFIAISTYNNEMGDWIINEFLKSGRIYKHASLVGEIIMCNKKELPRRLNFLKEHVMSQLKQIVKEDRSTHTSSIKKLLPFIQIFIQTLRIAAQDLKDQYPGEKFDLGIKQSYLIDTVSLLSNATQEREIQTKILVQLIVILLCPPSPFINSSVNPFEYAMNHLIDEEVTSVDNSQEAQLQKESLASILAASRSQIAMEIFKRGIKLDKLLNLAQGTNIENETLQNQNLQHCLKFWINVSQDAKIKEELSKSKIPLKIYENLRQVQPESSNKIIRRDSVFGENELYLMVELIKTLVAGNPSLESELAQLLMQDLEFLSRIRDMNFVNKVFLPLLRMEKTVPVCLWPLDSDNKKWLSSYKPQPQQDNQTQSQGLNYSNFVPSSILTGEKRSVFIKNMKEHVGNQSKAQVKKLLTSNWTLAHSQTEHGTTEKFQNFWKNIENKGPVVVLLNCTSANNQNYLFGCYSTKGIPAMPQNLSQDSDYPVNSNPEDFVFCYIEDNSYHHFAPKASVPIISMFTDYEGGGAISIANDFILMSFSIDFVFTLGIQYDLEKILQESNPKPEKEIETNGMQLVKFEIWSLDTTKVGSGQQTLTQNNSNTKTSTSLGENQLQQQLLHELKHPWFNNLSPFINYRTNPVFMVPAQLQLSQLSKIMLESNVFFKTRINDNHISQSSETVQELYQQMWTNKTSYESLNGIVDLEYEINQLLNTEQAKTNEENKDGEDTQAEKNGQAQLSGYVPKMGLFEAFEDKGGVKLIISVTLQSMKLWKSEEQSKSWELWLKELESFSEIPLFFQFFLKNNRCKDLLFKVLAGLPDQEIAAEGKTSTDAKTRWDEEQKVAVQFNYKILSEAFQTSNDLKLRETAMRCGLLPRILERLSAISGEKPRTYEEETKLEEIKKEIKQQEQTQQQSQAEKNSEKKKRKGVGYSSKVGQTFNVTQYLENKKLRNEQIKNLIDICANFLNSKEWMADEEVLDIVFESALLPILESAFRNGSWLDMAKENEVYHSYLALTRALAQQKVLNKCLIEIDSRYKPSQTEPIYKLLAKLNDLADIFINCLNQQQKAEAHNQVNIQKAIYQEAKQQDQLLQSQPVSIQQLNETPQQLQDNNPFNIFQMLQSSLINKLHSPNESVHEEIKEGTDFFSNPFNKIESLPDLKDLLPKEKPFNFLPNPFDIEELDKVFTQSQNPSKMLLNNQSLNDMLHEKNEQITLTGAMKQLLESKQNTLPSKPWLKSNKPINFSVKYNFKTSNKSYSDVDSSYGEELNSQIGLTPPLQDKIPQQDSFSNDTSSYSNSQKSNSQTSQSNSSSSLTQHKLVLDEELKDLEMEKALMKFLQDQNQQLQEKKLLMIEEQELIKKLEKQNDELSLLQKKLEGFEEPEVYQSHSYASYGESEELSEESKKSKQSFNQKQSNSSDYITLEEESIDSQPVQDKVQHTLTKKMKNLDSKLKSISSKFKQIKKKNYNLLKHNKLKLKTQKPKLQKKYQNHSVSSCPSESSSSFYDSEDNDNESNYQQYYSSNDSSSYSNPKDSFELYQITNNKKPKNLIPSLGKNKIKEKYSESSSSSYDSEDSDDHLSINSSDNSEEDSDAPQMQNYSESSSSNESYVSIKDKAQNMDQQDKFIEIDSQIPENLARDVIRTYKIVQAAVSKLLKDKQDENFVENALLLPCPQSYKILLQGLRFDYMDMKDPNDASQTTYKHHYNSYAQQNQNPPSSKMVRLAQELADLSNALPSDHTNAIYVRVDSQRVDVMKAVICGASNTPYAHGIYEYDIFCDNNYPREPPKMTLITTGSGSVRFNPNLYACGKVCLSLLGTWRGSATENWDPKLSTILQVLLSTQAIIMSEEVYFNEPGFENEAGTPEGEKKNEGYQNIVRYCNVKFAMIDQIKNPPKGFETVVKRHFYIKKEEIMKEVNHWVELAEKNEATYTGLVNDHNYNWANQFKQTKTKYKEMLVAAVQQLQEELNKLERPSDYELKLQQDKQMQSTKAQQNKKKRQSITEGKAELGEIDMEYEEEQQTTQIDTEKKEIDIEDEAVKDRWSRYIGAMGVEAVAKQAAANIFLSGAGALGIEIAKNIVLSGCKSFTLHDFKPITMRDLSGQFFLNYEEDVLNEKKKKNTRGEACMPRLKQLNFYVKCNLAPSVPIPLDENILESPEWNFKAYDVIILTEANNQEIIFVNDYCRKHGKKLIVADSFGVFTRVFTDFGDKFEVLDKNGEDLQDVMIKSISNEEQGIVELLPISKHKFEDGDEVLITGVEGMKLLPGKEHDDKAFKSESINDTIHQVKVINPYKFQIGDTTKFENYERNGIAKQLKVKRVMEFKEYKECMIKTSAELPLDGNLAVSDFEKMQNNNLSHIAFEALDEYRNKHSQQLPGAWNKDDAEKFIKYATEIAKRYDMNPNDWKLDTYELKFLYLFSFTAQGVFNPLCAYQGGVVAQECVKAITQKFSPIQQVFYYDAIEVLPDFDPSKDLSGDSENYFQEKFIKEIVKTQEIGHRTDGLRILLGGDLCEKLGHTRLFMVGAGAIGCELLKNYAMLGIGTGKEDKAKKLPAGSIVLTDPDVIEVSNLNRQFLFREKHLRKPKSSTAAAAAIYMNKELKENIIARLDKVHEGTAYIFTDAFFEELTVVTNALDNIHARRYIDSRCVTAKTPLLESGTLGPKGHVQVVLPYKTESYGSQNDPEDNTEIPHCTLKMFPEETLHCVEWARDKFGKMFTQGPQTLIKVLDEGEKFNPYSQQEMQQLKQAIKLLEKRPKTFDECIAYARQKFEKLFNHDIRQLLHVYPLDSKTKDGNLFWSLPKRPPVPQTFDPSNQLHCLFITALACLRATIFKVDIPSKQPRSEEFRKEIGIIANKISVPDFVPNDEKAKEIQASVQKETKAEDQKEGEPKVEEESKNELSDVELLMKKFKTFVEEINKESNKINTEKIVEPENFEKDNDSNHHIDIIYSMANCRSTNYKLDPMDWITVKLKAGRIVPALSTTTSAVAGLQTLELVKLLKNCKKTDHRNVFLNLAIPIMQASEPGDVIKTKLTEGIETTLWDRWEVKKGKDVTLMTIIKYIEENHKGLEVRDVLKGNAPLYFHAIMNAPGKEKDKEKILHSTLADLVGADSDDKYVDIAVTCIKKGDESEQILTGVPPVRVFFE